MSYLDLCSDTPASAHCGLPVTLDPAAADEAGASMEVSTPMLFVIDSAHILAKRLWLSGLHPPDNKSKQERPLDDESKQS